MSDRERDRGCGQKMDSCHRDNSMIDGKLFSLGIPVDGLSFALKVNELLSRFLIWPFVE